MWSFIASWWWLIIISLISPGLIALSIFAQRQLSKEIGANEKFTRPDEQQVAWHVQHTREDIIYLCYLVLLGFVIVIVLLCLIANKLHVFDWSAAA